MKHIGNLSAIDAAIDQFITRQMARANDWTATAAMWANPMNAPRRMIGNHFADQNQRRATQRAHDIAARALTLVRRVRTLDTNRRLAHVVRAWQQRLTAYAAERQAA